MSGAILGGLALIAWSIWSVADAINNVAKALNPELFEKNGEKKSD